MLTRAILRIEPQSRAASKPTLNCWIVSTESGMKSSPHAQRRAGRRLVFHLLGICCVPVDGLQDERPAQVHFEGNN